jgi:hypothetical protein
MTKPTKKKNATKVVVRAPTRRTESPMKPDPHQRAIAECALKYVHARLDPFSPKAIGACRFGSSTMPTFKCSNRSMTTHAIDLASASLGSTHLTLIWRPNASNDVWGLCIAPDTAAGRTISALIAEPTSVFINEIGSFFPQTQFVGGELESRVVGAGLRVMCTGAPLYLQGTTESLVPADQLWSEADTPAATMRSSMNTRYHAKRLQSEHVMLYDNEANNDLFRGSPFINGVPNESIGTLRIPADASTPIIHFTVETVSHWEVSGREVRPASSATPSSSNLYDKLSEGVSNVLQVIGHKLPSAPSLIQALWNFTGLNGPRLLGFAGQAAVKAIGF